MHSILISSFFRCISIVVGVLSVPLLLKIMDSTDYGIWVTLTSVLYWSTAFDLGVGNSLRNSSAQMTFENRRAVLDEFVKFFHLLFIILAFISFVVVVFIKFKGAFGGSTTSASLIFTVVFLAVPLNLGLSVLQGRGRIALSVFIQSSPAWLFFVSVCIFFVNDIKPSLWVMSVCWSVLLIFSALSAFVFGGREIGFNFSEVYRFRLANLPVERLKVGLKFLALQLSSITLYSLGNIINYQVHGAVGAANYDVINKVFQAFLGFYSIVIAYAWSQISKFIRDKEFVELEVFRKRMLYVAMVFSAACICFSFVLPEVIVVWTSGKIVVDVLDCVAVGLLVSLQSLAYVGAVYMNAFEKIGIQIKMALASVVLFFPVCAAFSSLGAGISSVAFSGAVLTAVPLVVCNVIARKLVREGGEIANQNV